MGFRAGMIGLHSRDDNAIRLPAMTIQVNVRIFASLRERVGRGEAVLELPAGATAAEAWARPPATAWPTATSWPSFRR